MPRGPRKPVGCYFGTILKTFSDVFSGHSFQRMHREKLKESEREAPTSNGRARARSARARAHPRLSRLAGLQLGMLWFLLRSCCSRCLCSCSSSSPLLFRLLLRLQCLTLPCFSRFPFYDSQAGKPYFAKTRPPFPAPLREASGGSFWSNFGAIFDHSLIIFDYFWSYFG